MLLADFVVTYSLQLNNRCLRYLADCEVRGDAVMGVEVDTIRPDVSVYAESLLTRDARRLYSMWELFQLDLEHVDEIGRVAEVLTGSPTHKLLALRLASIASDDAEAQAMVRIVRASHDPAELTWDFLNELFLTDSSYWRDSAVFELYTDERLLERIARNYKKGAKAARAYLAMAEDKRVSWLGKHAPGWLRWAQHLVHQLELLRPRLSEKGKAQLWYLEKLADTLRTRVGLVELEALIKSSAVDKPTRKVARRFVAQQVLKMDRRLERLLESSYGAKQKRFVRVLEHALAGDELERVALLAVPRPKRAATEAGSAH